MKSSTIMILTSLLATGALGAPIQQAPEAVEARAPAEASAY